MTASSLANLETKVKAEKGYRSDSASHVQTGMPGFVCPRADAYGGRDGVIPPGIAAQRGLVPRGMREVTLAEASASSQAIRALREKGVTDSDIYRDYYGRGLAAQAEQAAQASQKAKNASRLTRVSQSPQSAQVAQVAQSAQVVSSGAMARKARDVRHTKVTDPNTILSKRGCDLGVGLNLGTLNIRDTENRHNNQTQSKLAHTKNTNNTKTTNITKTRLNKKAIKELNERNRFNNDNDYDDTTNTHTTQNDTEESYTITQLKQEIISGLQDTLIAQFAQLTQGHNAVAQSAQIYTEDYEENYTEDYEENYEEDTHETFENTEENEENNENTHTRLFSEENNRHYSENSLDAFYDRLQGTKLGMREGTAEENESLLAARGEYRTIDSTDSLIGDGNQGSSSGQYNATRRIAVLEDECDRLRAACRSAEDALKELKAQQKPTQSTPGENIRVVLGSDEERVKVGGKGWECKVLGTLHFGYQRHEVILVIRDPNYASELIATIELGSVVILSSSLRTYCRYEGQCAKLYGDAASVESEEPSYIACFRFKVEGTDELTSQS